MLKLYYKFNFATEPNIPYKWESPQNSDYSQMDKVTRKAIEDNVETIYIKPHDNKTVAKLASKVKYNK
ncbi:MAG: hypothetical protein HLX47_13095 [Staphylococcus sp.]|uniref:hypothetical protein n=1 Tax=Staphylococcus sp. TaxID=29387 RepID=UPI0017ED3CA8|nr:hypothetical protein [Staphylococcus sp.]NWN86799.1 hypothetical protein [Staphylococcus sp.]